jgi:hypothetical protein
LPPFLRNCCAAPPTNARLRTRSWS